MKNSEYKRYTLLFDLTDLSDDMRFATIEPSRAYSQFISLWAMSERTPLFHYFRDKPVYEDTRYLIVLTSEHWFEYQLIKQLPVKQIIEHFLNQSN